MESSLKEVSGRVVEARNNALDIVYEKVMDKNELENMEPSEFAMFQAFIKLVKATNELTERTALILESIDKKLGSLEKKV